MSKTNHELARAAAEKLSDVQYCFNDEVAEIIRDTYAEAMAPKWIACSERMPECDENPGSIGVQVLVWPPFKNVGCADSPIAFYGRRVTDEPGFYLYGRVINVTHWQPLPQPPEVTT